MSTRCARALLAGLIAAASIVAIPATAATDGSSDVRLGFFCLRVMDLERSLAFYTQVLGMKEWRRLTTSTGVIEVMLAYGDSPDQPGVMLMHDPRRTKPYELGDGFSRFLLYVSDIASFSKRLSDAGAPVVRPVTDVERLGITVMLVKDPDGYVIELVKRDR